MTWKGVNRVKRTVFPRKLNFPMRQGRIRDERVDLHPDRTECGQKRGHSEEKEVGVEEHIDIILVHVLENDIEAEQEARCNNWE